MYPITQAVAALFEAENAQVLRITGTDKNGATTSITDADIIQGSFSIDRYCCNGSKIEVGTAVAAELKLKLNNAGGAFDDIVFEGTELFVEIGVADWDNWSENPAIVGEFTVGEQTVSPQNQSEITYIPCGYFICEEQPRKQTIISITALDRMTKLDVAQPTLVNWVDHSGNYITDSSGNVLMLATELSFPCTVSNLVSQICNLRGITLASSINSLPNASYNITALPTIQQTITYRNLIQWCAGLMGTCAFMDWNGQLCFKWYSAASYTSTPAKRYNSDLQENDITITGVSYTNTENATLISGAGDYTIDLTGNYLIGGGEATVLPNLNTALNGFTYRPFTANVIAAPWLWPLDVITFTDKDNVNHSCIVSNVNIALNAHTALAGNGEPTQVNDGVAPSGMTKEQGLLVEQVAQSTVKLDESLNQESIFNRLTNNGQTQGIILHDGQIYINASYIQTGTLSADLIKAGVIQDVTGNSYWNLANGAMRVLGQFIAKTSNQYGAFSMELTDGAIKLYRDYNGSTSNPGEIRYNEYGIPISTTETITKTYTGIEGESVALRSGENDDVAMVHCQDDGTVSMKFKKVKLYPPDTQVGDIYISEEREGYTGTFTFQEYQVDPNTGIEMWIDHTLEFVGGICVSAL